MWDGNLAWHEITGSSEKVEREPMWDGNVERVREMDCLSS